jgi:putative ABC transport system permease protein
MRLYRALLHLYPKSFRAEYGDDLCRSFAENTRGRSGPARVAAALADVVPNAFGMCWDALRRGLSGGVSLRAIGNDIRFAFRQIARTPLFSAVVITVIALGIGINAGLMTTLNRYVWRPAPGIEPDSRLARLNPTASRGETGQRARVLLSYPDILDLRGLRDVFDEVAAWRTTSVAADFGGGAETVRASYTTANYFKVLGVVMAAGGSFPEGADRSAEPVTVIGHSLWMSHFNGSKDALGKTIRVMNVPFTVVGVAPPHFTGVDVLNMGEPSIWIPLGAQAPLDPTAHDNPRRRDAMSFRSFARLAPGVDSAAIERRTAGVAAHFAREDPAAHKDFSIRAEPLLGMSRERSDTTETEVAFFLVAGLVVVITCTNVSALLLGRAVARRREVGVRLSLGASRLRIVRQMLTESFVLAMAGALLGLVIYVVSMKIAYATIPEVIYGLQPEPMTFMFAALFALVAAVVFGLAPALHASGTGVFEVIKNGGTPGIRRSRLQATFVVAQLASSQPVLVVTSLVLADLRSTVSESVSNAPDSVLTMSLELRGRTPIGNSSRETPGAMVAANRATLARVRQRLEDIPNTESVALSIRGGEESFETSDHTPVALKIREVHVAAGYFSTLGVPLLRGRAIGVEEDQPGSVAIVVNEEAAKRLWPNEDPIGKRLLRKARDGEGASGTFEVVGVAGGAPSSDDPNALELFAPMSNATVLGGTKISVRFLGGDARALESPIRAAIREVDPLATIDNVRTLAQQDALRRREAVLSNLAAFVVGMAALLLASLGLYAIIAFAVAQRTQEIGVRLAIGATPRTIVRHFCRDGLKVTLIGLAIGLPVTVAGIRIVQANALGFTLQNVAAVLLVIPVLVVVAGLASWLPARRAGRVDPLIALRTD